MKKKTIYFLLILVCMPLSALRAETHDEAAALLFAKANAAYDSGDYQVAARIYDTIYREGWQSWQLYYNMGNTYYRLDEIALAVLNYERALRLAPGKKIISENLELARSKTTDKIDELPRLFLLEWIDAVVNTATPRGWRIIVIILVALLSAALCIFFIAKDYRIRKSMFICGTVVLVLLIFSIINATISVKNVTDKSKAIVMEPLLVVKGSPDAKSVDKFILHEGTKLTITDRQDEWWQVEIADGKSGWIAGGAEVI